MPDSLSTECSVPTRGRTLDYAAAVYDWLSPLMTFGHEKRIGQEVLSLLSLKGDERVLDVGCGTGTLTLEAGRRLSPEQGGCIVGIDAAAKMIRVARKKAEGLKQVRFDVCAAEQLGYDDAAFDLALSTFFFHHVDMQLKVAVLNEIWRTLKRGGRAIIADVDTPTGFFGRLCAWSGYLLFQQEEIRENIKGKLRVAIRLSKFRDFTFISSHLGYVSLFMLEKGNSQ